MISFTELVNAFAPEQKQHIDEVFFGSSEKSHISLCGLNETSLALLTAPFFEKLKQHQLFVFPDRESAAFFYHDLEFLLNDQERSLQDKVIHYFPASYRRACKYEEVDNANVKLRAEIINKLANDEGHYIIVTYPEAISEKILSKKYIQSNSFTVTKGEILPVDTFLDFLFEYGYKQEEFVFEPGQFAWRGGIFDVFSFSEETPYRIELNGEAVESIRQFDTNTQLSVKEVDRLNIMPYISSVEIVEKRVSIFDFLGKETLCWSKNIRDIKAQLNANFKKMSEEFANAQDGTSTYNPADYYIDGEIFQQEIVLRKWAEINANTAENSILTIDFDIKPQNSFGKNFNLLLDEWIGNLEHGYQTVFLSDNENQQERVKNVLSDLLDKYNQSKKTEYTIEQLYTSCNFVLHEGFVDEKSGLCVYTDHQFFEKYHRFQIRDRYKKSEQFTLKEIYDLQPGDYVVHIDHGIGIYEGLQKMDVNGKEQEVIKLSYKDGDLLYISIHSLHKITKYVGKDGMPPKLHRLGSSTWDRVKERTKKRVKEIAIDLIKLYAQRKAKDGFAYSSDTYMQNELEASFIYEDTPDQVKSLNEVKNDMESRHPMDRLICGDVGFGKTEIAVRAAFKAVADSKQVAVLVPTTVLALQHYTTFSERLQNMPCKVEYVNRFKSAKQIKEILRQLKEGSVDIIIGTHRLLSKDVEFKDLGLLIIDEEQKFGVGAKEKLRELKYDVDTLTMSATPIPRTLQFSLMGARDISVITTPPPNRYPIQTEVHLFDEAMTRDEDVKTKEFLQILQTLRMKAGDMSCDELIWYLYAQLHVMAIFGAMEGGKTRKEHLTAFYTYAQDCAAKGKRSLFDFVTQVRRLIKNGKPPMFSTNQSSGGVQIMSIHKSKGLEFPIVLLCDVQKKFNKEDLYQPVLVHPELGLGTDCVDRERGIRYDTISRTAIQKKLEREGKSEELRLLYVAMTRAREKLIIT
ncbi:MAG: DEAD/DEAH box helicase, partial [Bacteroidales bacterium]|nr:DEAD/DEAH box helicase [Bacteroidales bacterium]